MIAIYARTSTQDSEGIQRQIESCMKETKGDNVDIFQDCGVSGLSQTKPQLDLLIEKAKHGSLKKVIVTNHSRISRNPLETAKIVNQLNNLGLEVIFTESK